MADAKKQLEIMKGHHEYLPDPVTGMKRYVAVPKVFQEFPKCIYRMDRAKLVTKTVKNAEEEAKAGPGWFPTPLCGKTQEEADTVKSAMLTQDNVDFLAACGRNFDDAVSATRFMNQKSEEEREQFFVDYESWVEDGRPERFEIRGAVKAANKENLEAEAKEEKVLEDESEQPAGSGEPVRKKAKK